MDFPVVLSLHFLDFPHSIFDDIAMHLSQLPVDLDIAVIMVGRETDQFISPDQAAEALRINAAGRHILRFVDDKA